MSISSLALRSLATARMLLSSSCLVVPGIVCPFVGIPLHPQSIILARLFGVRDFALGALLWRATTAYSMSRSGATEVAKLHHDKGNEEGITVQQLHQRDLQLALAVGIFCDVVDVISSIVCVFEGNLTDMGKIMVMGGANLFAIVGIWQVRKL